MKEHFRKLDYFEYLLSKRPVFTVEHHREVFLIKFIGLGKGDQYRLEVDLTGSNVFKISHHLEKH